MSTIFTPVLNQELIINYKDKHRIVIPKKHLNDGFLATENGLYKQFKYAKLQDVEDVKANELIHSYNFEPQSAWSIRENNENENENIYTTPKKRTNTSIPDAPRKKKFERRLTF
jgi:hypothetical protein